MKINLLLIFVLIITISSCSTAYRVTQTPDDVYYSPVHLQYDSVRTNRDKYKESDNTVYENSEDREIRRRVHNRRYKRYDDRYDYPYWSNYPYANNYPNGNTNPVYADPKYGTPPTQSQPRKTNLGAYKPNATTDSSRTYDPKSGNQNAGTTTAPVRTFGSPANNANNNGTGVGNFIRKVFSGDNNSYPVYRSDKTYHPDNSNNSTPSRTFDRSSNTNSNTNNSNNSSSNNSSSSSSNKSGSTSAPVRTFGKDN